MIVQLLVGFVPPNATGDGARHVPGVVVGTAYAGLPLRAAVNVNDAVSAVLLRVTVTGGCVVFGFVVLETPGPRSLKTIAVGVTVG